MSTVYAAIAAERARAHAKHAPTGCSVEGRHPLDPCWLPVLVEEVGEVARALNDGGDLAELHAELVQVAAMAAAWADATARALAGAVDRGAA